MRKFLFLCFYAALCLPVCAHAGPCPGESEPPVPPPPTGTVCGAVWWVGYNGHSTIYRPATKPMYVRICPAGVTNFSQCSTVATYTATANGQSIQAYKFLNYRQGASGYAAFDFYAWAFYNDDNGSGPNVDYWGSSTKPIHRYNVGPYGNNALAMLTPPKPLPPTPVYPSGNNVPSGYLVRWQSGIDQDRLPYPATYEVWYKYWPFGGNEPASFLLARADMPCQDDGTGPDGNNECSTYVVGPQLAGNWKWYVVANLAIPNYYFPGTVFTTKSTSMGFIQPY